MNKLPKITYKKSPKPKGLASVGAAEIWYAKFKGKQFAIITHSLRRPISIQICVEKDPNKADSNPNCSWEWLFLEHSCQSTDEAKALLESSLAAIVETRTLHYHDL